MTLDEAITHAREIAKYGGECAKDHEQLAEWLEELHKLRAIADTFGKPKAKSHPYGYEPDTGAFDATRCECGCINDISATYCNDCGGEIEIDMNAEKEIYHTPAHMVFAEKHDDGSLEFAGKRYIAATLGSAGVDDALALLDEANEQGRIEYGDYSQLHDAIATLGRGTCKPTEEDCCPICGEDLVRCNVGIGALGGAVELDPPIYHNYCPNCGVKVAER